MIEIPFCNGPFLDPDLSWNTTDPNLTQCMRDTVLVGVPSGILWILGPFWIYRCYLKKLSLLPVNVVPKLSFLFVAKLSVTLLLLVNAIGEVIYRFNSMGWDVMHPSDLFQPLCLLTTYGISIVMLILEKLCRSHTSPPQFMFLSLIHI